MILQTIKHSCTSRMYEALQEQNGNMSFPFTVAILMITGADKYQETLGKMDLVPLLSMGSISHGCL